jgi:hypothetical protein
LATIWFTEARFTMLPLRACIIGGSTARQARNTADRAESMVSSHSSSVQAWAGRSV